MPSDDYAVFSGGGILKLKGGKISKNKKKKKDRPTDLERSLSTGEASASKELEKSSSSKKRSKDEERVEEEAPEEEEPVDYKTEAQRRHEEYKKKKVCHRSPFRPDKQKLELIATHTNRCWNSPSRRARGQSC